jgi:hypothetical protein
MNMQHALSIALMSALPLVAVHAEQGAPAATGERPEEAVSAPAASAGGMSTSQVGPRAGMSAGKCGQGGPHGARGKGMAHGMHGQGKGHGGHGKGGRGEEEAFHRQLLNRLDMLDARLAKIEVIVEKLMER